MKSLFILSIAFLLGVTLCGNSVFITSNVTNFTCFKDKKIQTVFIRGFLSTGRLDPYLISNMEAAAKVFYFKPNIYMTPCLKVNMRLEDQIKLITNATKNLKKEVLIIKVLRSNNWPANKTNNCKNIKVMMNTARNNGVNSIVESNKGDWDVIAGSDCRVGAGAFIYVIG